MKIKNPPDEMVDVDIIFNLIEIFSIVKFEAEKGVMLNLEKHLPRIDKYLSQIKGWEKISHARDLAEFLEEMNQLKSKYLMKLAIKYYKIANVENPTNDFEIYDREIANIYLKLGKKREAVKHLKRALKIQEKCKLGTINYCGPENPEADITYIKKEILKIKNGK